MNSCLFVGVDTHKDSHTTAVLDRYFDVVSTVTFANDKAGYARLETCLGKISCGRDIIFGLEDSQGLGSFLAAYLVGKGYIALEINPVTTDRGRKHTVSRDKSDELDAIVIPKTLMRERKNLHLIRINRKKRGLKRDGRLLPASGRRSHQNKEQTSYYAI